MRAAMHTSRALSLTRRARRPGPHRTRLRGSANIALDTKRAGRRDVPARVGDADVLRRKGPAERRGADAGGHRRPPAARARGRADGWLRGCLARRREAALARRVARQALWKEGVPSWLQRGWQLRLCAAWRRRGRRHDGRRGRGGARRTALLVRARGRPAAVKRAAGLERLRARPTAGRARQSSTDGMERPPPRPGRRRRWRRGRAGRRRDVRQLPVHPGHLRSDLAAPLHEGRELGAVEARAHAHRSKR